jgi:formylglycine-generating enzyme
MKSRSVVLAVAVAVVLAAGSAQADVFNMGSGLTSLDMVPVGDPGNAADYTGFGAVGYAYRMGKYDVTAGQYCQFLNAVAKNDTYGLYDPNMANLASSGWYSVGCGILQSGTSGSYTYSVRPDAVAPGSPLGYAHYADFPVNWVSWGDAVRFVNWLQNGQPTGAEGSGTTETGAYTLNGATSGAILATITRNPGATYFLPTESEWYKAAYFKGAVDPTYWAYPTQSDSGLSNIFTATGTNNGNFDNYGGAHHYTDSVNYLTPVGAFAASPGPYGTYDQGGDVWQWNEAEVTHGDYLRGIRGGSFSSGIQSLGTSVANYFTLVAEDSGVGFRIASIATPEPGSIVLVVVGGLCLAAYAWRRRRADRI